GQGNDLPDSGFHGVLLSGELGVVAANIWGKRSLRKTRRTCQDKLIMVAKSDASLRRPLNYSVRNAFIGVTRVARCAGKKQARIGRSGSIVRNIWRTAGIIAATARRSLLATRMWR